MKADKKYGIGIAGCGTIADIHAETIGGMANGELVSVYSRNIDHAVRVGEKFHVKANDEWKPFIEDERLEIVSICTPSGTHLDYGKWVADAGKHVVVEKPIEVTLDRGKRLIDVCRHNNVKLAVIYQNRYLPDAIRMKKMIDDGKIGKVFLGVATIKW